jgi:hypothetical protein
MTVILMRWTSAMPKTPELSREDENLRRLMKMPPAPFTPKTEKKSSPGGTKAKKPEEKAPA